MLNIKSTSLATLLSISSLLAFSNPSLAAPKSYTVDHTYKGVKRCGRTSENQKEARRAADGKVRQIESTTGLKVQLKEFKVLSANTKHRKKPWPDNSRYCKTKLKVFVKVDIQV